MTSEPFVPPDFVVPLRLETPQFVLEPLGPQHNDAGLRGLVVLDGAHPRAHPAGKRASGRVEMTLDENRADLDRHASDFENRTGFTYTVLSPGGDVIGCVYIYPSKKESVDAHVLSWVRASDAELDEPLWRAVSGGSSRTGRSKMSSTRPATEREVWTASRACRCCSARRRCTGWSG